MILKRFFKEWFYFIFSKEDNKIYRKFQRDFSYESGHVVLILIFLHDAIISNAASDY